MIDIVPGAHGEGVEIPCLNEAVWMLDDVPCCERHYYPEATEDYTTICRIWRLGNVPKREETEEKEDLTGVKAFLLPYR